MFLGIDELIAFLESGGRLEKPDLCPRELYKIMMDCWHKKPLQRPTFKQLKHRLEAFAPKKGGIEQANSANVDHEHSYVDMTKGSGKKLKDATATNPCEIQQYMDMKPSPRKSNDEITPAKPNVQPYLDMTGPKKNLKNKTSDDENNI